MTIRRQVLVLSGLLASAVGGAGQDPLVDAVQKRQESVRSVDIRFHVKEFVAKGAYSEVAAILPGGKPGRVTPPRDVSLESDNRLVIDGIKVRFENNHPALNAEDGAYSRKLQVAVTNGELSKMFYPDGMATDSEIVGIIRPDAQNQAVHLFYTLPLLMHFRGTDLNLASYKALIMKRTGQTLPIAGRMCEEYQQPISKDIVGEFWYDPSAAYELRRLRKLRLGTPSEQTDIEYQPVPGGTAPKSWVRTEYDGGKVRKTTTVTVTDIRINPELDASEFEVTFPPGTHVHDQRVSKEYRVQPDGSMRELDLYGNDTGETVAQPGTPWWSRNKWLLTGIAAALLLLVVLTVRRKARKAMPAS